MKFNNVLCISVMILLLSSCAGYKLVPAGASASVGAITVVPNETWNKVPFKPGKRSSYWTQNGQFIDELLFVDGLAEGGSIFKERNKSLPMPKFKADMLPNDVQDLVSSSIKNSAGGEITINTSTLKPREVSGKFGFTFKIDFFNSDGLLFKGDAIAVISEEKLYMILSVAAATHYYERSTGEIEQIFASMEI